MVYLHEDVRRLIAAWLPPFQRDRVVAQSKGEIQSSRIWKYIFKSDDWLERIMSIQESGPKPHTSHLPIPLLLGVDLRKVARGKTQGCYLSLLVQDWNGHARFEKEQFFKSLQKHEYDEKKRKITLVDSGIELNIDEVISSPEILHIEDPRRLFGRKRKALFSLAMYYGTAKVVRINKECIKGIEGVTTKDKKCVAEICQMKLESRFGLPLWIIFESMTRSTDVVGLFERGKSQVVGWRKLMPGERAREVRPHYFHVATV